jgi:hypothetical protein
VKAADTSTIVIRMAEPTHPVARLLAEHGPLRDDDIPGPPAAHRRAGESPLVDELPYPAV